VSGATSGVRPEQRFTRQRPCAICGGHDQNPRGQGKRCHGFISEDGEWAHCTREEHAGDAPYNDKSGAFVHKLTGDCKCGVRHDLAAGGEHNGRTRSKRRSRHEDLGPIVATYDYTDERGELLYQVVRYEPEGQDKTFRQRRPDKRSGWVWSLQGVRRVLYRLPDLLAADPGELVLKCEGEKDTDCGRDMGFKATTNVGGAKNWRAEYAEPLWGRPVAIIADNDSDGHEHAEDVARTLYGKASSVKVVHLPGVPETGGDLCDYADASGTAEDLRRLIDETPEWKPPEGWDDGELPKIVVNNRHLREVTTEALEALATHNDPPEVFVRAGRLVRVREDENGIPEIQTMEDSHVKGRLARVADFVRITEKGETKVNPPDWTVKDIQALDTWPFPALEAVVEAPIMRPDGTIFDAPGYDPQTRLYYRPVEGLDVPEIPAVPTEPDIKAAISLLDEAVGEFPYEDGSSAANTLALILTPLVRQAVNGPVPLALIDKPQAGTGGSLLAETVAVIGSGHTAEMLGAPRDEEEWRKQITAKLSAGATMITVDNVEGALYAPSLARALTARTWTDRVLGRSETVTISQRATWIATGNNIQLRGDLPRRCYWIRLDAREARPWQRQNFRHPDLLGWVTKNRGRLIHALLTLARAWFAVGKPKAPNLPQLGSFEAWTETVGGMVAFAGIPGFLGNLSALYDKADEGSAEWEEFLLAWWETFAERPVTVAQLTKQVKNDEGLREALPPDLAEAFDKSEASFSRRLGNALSKRAGTRYGEDALHVVRAGELRRAVRWQLQKGPSECEFVSFVSLYNPSAGNFQEQNKPKEEEKKSEGAETNSTNSQTHTNPPEEHFEPSEEDWAEFRDLFEEDLAGEEGVE
jgi:hypothetical protein